MSISRYWINAHDNDHLLRYLHRTRVLADLGEFDRDGHGYAYFLEGSVLRAFVRVRDLESGWPLETYIQHPFSGKRSF